MRRIPLRVCQPGNIATAASPRGLPTVASSAIARGRVGPRRQRRRCLARQGRGLCRSYNAEVYASDSTSYSVCSLRYRLAPAAEILLGSERDDRALSSVRDATLCSGSMACADALLLSLSVSLSLRRPPFDCGHVVESDTAVESQLASVAGERAPRCGAERCIEWITDDRKRGERTGDSRCRRSSSSIRRSALRRIASTAIQRAGSSLRLARWPAQPCRCRPALLLRSEFSHDAESPSASSRTCEGPLESHQVGLDAGTADEPAADGPAGIAAECRGITD